MVTKAWSYTASKIKDTKVIFTYDVEKEESKEINIIMEILKEYDSEVLLSEDVFNFIFNDYLPNKSPLISCFFTSLFSNN